MLKTQRTKFLFIFLFERKTDQYVLSTYVFSGCKNYQFLYYVLLLLLCPKMDVLGFRFFFFFFFLGGGGVVWGNWF